jgi:uncharacterized membrane protein (UPF0182 family)
VPRQPKFKIRIPKSFIFLIVVICAIALLLYASWFGWIEYETIFLWAQWLMLWVVVIVLALIGAIFVGMYLAHRILSIGGFTPFERAMLKMREDVKKINERLGIIEKTLTHLKEDAMHSKK